MKKLLGIIVLGLLLSGCFFDKSEQAIMNCADTAYSNYESEKFDNTLNPFRVFGGFEKPKNFFDNEVLRLKEAGFNLEEITLWAYDLKSSEITDSNRDIIKFFINIRNTYQVNKNIFLKKNLTEKLQSIEYESFFSTCEFKRQQTEKMFDAKWKKSYVEPIIFRVE